MVKRKGNAGRPRKGEERGKSVSVTFRVTPALHALLETEKSERGGSLSAVIEDRLLRSYQLEQDAEHTFDRLGGEQNYSVFRLMALLIKGVEFAASERPLSDKVSWLANPWAFDQVAAGIQILLQELRRERELGEAQPPSRPNVSPEIVAMEGAMHARGLIAQLAAVSPAEFNKDHKRKDGSQVRYSDVLSALPDIKRGMTKGATK